MNHVDLFAGVGGFSLAAKWCGIETIQFVEIDPFCQKVLAKNFPDVPIHGDIKTFHYSDKVDLLTAGLPCQPFSQAGNKKGKQDERHLWPELLRVIKECRPRYLIIENVRGIVSIFLDEMLSYLEKELYKSITFLLPASSAKSPHRRDRIWVIAYDNSERSNNWINNRETRRIQENFKRYVEEIQSQWSQLIPDSWQTFTARDWLSYNSYIVRENDGVSSRLHKNRIKSLGNAIVPQVVFPIMKIICEIEKVSEHD